jgi:hypothetical protein
MNTERQPLLSTPETERHHIVRPDIRSSPVDVLVDVQNVDGKKKTQNEK